jgi:G3E family GTPase
MRRLGADERIAVLVNDFGDVGLDGPLLAGEDGVTVVPVAGGCVCCAQGPALQIALVRLLREVRPDRLWIEPSGLAAPGSIIDMLRAPGLREVVSLGATIAVIDPRRWLAGVYDADDAVLSQIELCDVLVASKADLADEGTKAGFEERARALWPPKLAVGTMAHGELDPAWLDLDPAPPAPLRFHAPVHAHAGIDQRGWLWPPEVRFDPHTLRAGLQALLGEHPAFPGGVVRMKGIFHLRRGWSALQWDGERLRSEPASWRRDSRVEFLSPEPADWDAVDGLLQSFVDRS